MEFNTPGTFREQISEAQKQLQALWQLKQIVDGRIEDLRDLIRANANFLPDSERTAELFMLDVFKVPSTITEAVKLTLFIARARDEQLTPLQIKEKAEGRGFDFSSYTNPMASIHTILKRMKDADPPEVTYNEGNSTYTIAGLPMEVASDDFYKKIKEGAWGRFFLRDSSAAKALTHEEMDDLFISLTSKRGKKRLRE